MWQNSSLKSHLQEKNTGNILKAAISELISSAAKEEGGDWLLNGTKPQFLQISILLFGLPENT